MNKAVFLIPIIAIMIVGGLVIATPTSETIETQSIVLTEQQRVDAELADRGLTLIDGKWYSPSYLAQMVAIEEMQVKADSEGWKFKAPLVLGGFANIIHKDAMGAILSSQTVHNRVPDQGEDFLIQQVFKEGNAGETVDADQIATICVSARVSFVDTSEGATASDFDTNDNLGAVNNCISDPAVSSTSQTAIIGALTFDAPTHVPNSTVITGIAICQGKSSTPFNLCVEAQPSDGIMWAIIDIADVTLESGETVDITYTADFSSSGS